MPDESNSESAVVELNDAAIEGFGEGADPGNDAPPHQGAGPTMPAASIAAPEPAAPAPASPSSDGDGEGQQPPGGAPTADDPVAVAKARADELRRQENDRILQEEADKKRREQAAAAARDVQPDGGDLTASLDAFEAYATERGLKFTAPDGAGEKIGFKQLREEYPYIAEMVAAMTSFGTQQAVDPLRAHVEREQNAAEFRDYVGRLEDPDGPAKLPNGSVEKLVHNPDFSKYFNEEQKELLPLISSENIEHVAIALRAFAKAKGIDLSAPDANAEARAAEQRKARDDAERRRNHRQAVHSGGPRGASGQRSPVLSAEEEALEGFMEGATD